MKRILILLALLVAVCVVQADRRALLMSKREAAAGSPTPDILWWKLNDGSGTSIAGSGSNGGDGGSTDGSWTTGKAGQCVDFNGSGADASTSSSINYSTNIITVSFWTNLDSTNSTRILIESSADYNATTNTFIIYTDAGRMYLSQLSSGSSYFNATNTSAIPTGTWVHWFAIFDRSSSTGDIRLWKDGVEESLGKGGNNSFSFNFQTLRLFVGARNSGSLFSDGRIDDLRIYSGARSNDVASVFADPK